MESEVLQTITNKLSYSPGEEVTIEMVNIGAETISGGGVYFSVYDLSGNLLAGNSLFLAFEWAPGEGFSSFTWDQTNENGEQVDCGTYVILGKAGDYSDARLISILPDPEMESEVLQTITNKLSYSPGEEVTIEMVNIGAETISGGGVYFSVYDMSGNLLAGNGLFLAFEWAPGEGFSSFTWDQTNENGEQVDRGTYVILGKTGDYSDAILISID